MFGLLPPVKIISGITGVYIALFAMTSRIFGIDSARTVFSSIALEAALLLFFHWGWRKLWKKFPKLNELLFPDLNGRWTSEVHWRRGDDAGVARGICHIKQDFFKISIEMDSKDSDSLTRIVVAKRDPESGRATLHYIYSVISKQANGGADSDYEGTALLRFKNDGSEQLEGNYYTSRLTKGFFRFEKISEAT